MNACVGRASVLFLVFLLAQYAAAADGLKWLQKPALSFNKQEKKWNVTFELSSLTDVEVANIDPEMKDLALQQAKAALLQARAAFEKAQKDFERNQKL